MSFSCEGEETADNTVQVMREDASRETAPTEDFEKLVKTVKGNFLEEKLRSEACWKEYMAAISDEKGYCSSNSFFMAKRKELADSVSFRKAPENASTTLHLQEFLVEKRTLIIGLEDVLAYVSTAFCKSCDAAVEILDGTMHFATVPSWHL